MSGWSDGFVAIASWDVLIMIPLGVLLGIAIGAVPGLSATVGMALFLPFAFSLDPLTGLVLLLGIYNGACYSGAIPAVLIRTPGTPSSAATTLDGYPMGQTGRAGQALTISLVASVIGGLVGTILLALFAPVLADYALNFGSGEYFAIAVLALTIIASISGEAPISKGFVSALLGLLIVFIGFDPIAGFPRFSFGSTQLSGGIEIIPLLVGIFGVAEALNQLERMRGTKTRKQSIGSFGLGKGWLKRLGPTVGGSTGIGFVTGLLPGVGGDVGGFMAYNETKRFAKDSSQFGKGDPRGVAAAESANNASNMGSLVPTFALGIPGNTQAAVLLGALIIAGVQPGPGLFESNPELIYGSFVAMTLAYVCLLVIGLAGIKLWVRVIQIPPGYLWPLVIVFSVVGSYAVRTNVFDVIVMLAAGLLGYLLTKGGYPVAPLLIAVIVGPLAEENFRRSMINSDGSLSWMLQPLTAAILALALASIVYSLVRQRRAANSRPKVAAGDLHA
ncbi:tripartite tricarboxylate transporter permease [Rhodococcus sp. ARC_M5]|uniref:tripartite tricarboxylate transporter permease n=1 Tax=Rhodococcus sp. ARC_M5 TaxID=2928851 RepID=UPI001FB25C46|nr:tripartite tricarboxylate transporter permease [Rhodococcus sp. ARC_M5]MCJ0893752.1 tripartite tricarboxylate transporter permease [Rhodococcus sp. ARC_M5]